MALTFVVQEANSASLPMAGSEVTTTSTTYVRLRSGAITLTNAKEYEVQFGTSGSDAGYFKGAKIIAA